MVDKSSQLQNKLNDDASELKRKAVNCYLGHVALESIR